MNPLPQVILLRGHNIWLEVSQESFLAAFFDTEPNVFSVYMNFIKWQVLVIPNGALHHLSHDLPVIHIGQFLDQHVNPAGWSRDPVMTLQGHGPKVNSV